METTTCKSLSALEAAQKLYSNVIAVHEYKNENGVLIYAKARRSTLPKVIPFHQTKNGEWVKCEPKWGIKKRPIYHLDEVTHTNGPVWVVEGEKCADALACLGLVATTSGSASSAGGADWSPLKGRQVRIWPDNDDAGRRYSEEVSVRLRALGCSVEVLSLDGLGLGPKEDCFDWLERHPNSKAENVEALPRVEPEILEVPTRKKEFSEDGNPLERLPDGSILLETETANFIVGKNGVFWEKFTNGRREPERLKVCSFIQVLAKTRTADSSSWGLLLEWRDPDGNMKRWACPRELLVGDSQALRRELASNGLEFGTSRKGVERFEEFLSAWPVKERALCVEKIGWCGDSFVTPNSVFSKDGGKNELVVYQNTKTTKPTFSSLGTLDGWKENVSKLAEGNSRLVFAISCAFAGPLLRFQQSGEDSGGFNLRGASSSGKTTALKAAASVWGSPSYVKQWRATTNGLEAIAEAHNDCLLILDELAQVDPQIAGECAYLLANGSGKSRMTKNLSAPPPKEWRLLFLSAGEISLGEHMLEAGKRSKAGQELRLADLPSDAGAGCGIIETFHNHPNAGSLINHIRDATMRNYGHAGKAWLEWLVSKDSLEKLLSIYFKMWKDDISESGKNGKSDRVLDRFGLVATAGELATEAGITGWKPGEAWRACKICAQAWFGAQKLVQSEEEAILDQVRNILETQSARFSDWDTDESENRIPNRLGFRRKLGGNGFELERFKWYIFRNVWRSEFCRGFSIEQMERTLLLSGILIPDKNGNVTQAVRSPLGVQRFYVIESKIFCDEL